MTMNYVSVLFDISNRNWIRFQALKYFMPTIIVTIIVLLNKLLISVSTCFMSDDNLCILILSQSPTNVICHSHTHVSEFNVLLTFCIQ